MTRVIEYTPDWKRSIPMKNAKKTNSGKWTIQAYGGMKENGKKIVKTFTADTKKEAESMAAAYEKGRWIAKHSITVGQAIDGYIDLKRNVLSPSTIHGYEGIRNNRLQSLMNMDVNEIDSILMQQAVNEDALRLSRKSLLEAVLLITAALKLYKVHVDLSVTLPPRKHKIKRLPTAQQVIQMVMGTDIELPCMLAMWLSLRMSEVRGLQFCDLDGNVLTVQRSRMYIGGDDIIRDVNKTYSSTRQLVVPDYLLKMILAVPHESDEDFIVQQHYLLIKKHLDKLTKANGFHMTFHDLRHLNASVMLMLGIPDKYAMERGGWSTNATLKAVYQHTFSDERKQVDAKIDAYFNEIVTSRQRVEASEEANKTEDRG